MGSVTLTGADTVILDAGRIVADLADGDTALLEFPNNLAEGKVGKNGNTIYAFNATGKTVNVTLRVLRGSADDKYLNSRMQEYLNDPASFILIEGEFIKRAGDGRGNITADIYRLSGGIVQKMPGAKENQEGDTEQSVAIWNLTFANSNRVLA